MASHDPPRRGVATIDDLRARVVIDPATRCWIWQGASRHGSPRIWTLHIDDMDKAVLSGPRAVWYIAHGTKLGGRVAYMACWTKGCVCPVHVRAGTRAEVNRLAGNAGLFNRTPQSHAACVANARKARQARGVVDTPADVVLAVRAAAGSGTQKAIGQRFGLPKSTVSRILRGTNFKHLLAGPAQAAP